MIVPKVYKKTNDSIRFAARKISNDVEGDLTDAEIVQAVSDELNWPLDPALLHDRIAIRAFRENRADVLRASQRAS